MKIGSMGKLADACTLKKAGYDRMELDLREISVLSDGQFEECRRKLLDTGLEFAVCNGILKPLIARPRPCDLNSAIQLLIPRPGDDSFPSGHSGISFAAVGALFAAKSRLWVPAFVLALIIAFSRLYLYVHWPSDVLVGALLGILLGFLAERLVRYLQRRRSLRG